MTDRAVVELSEHICTRCGYRHPVGMEGGSCLAAARVEIEPSPPPRALVALSDDRQWLVVLIDGEWLIHQRKLEGFWFYDTLHADMGQSAWDVLHEFLMEWGDSMDVEQSKTTAEYQTLLTCMAVDGGPKDCCGCFNGRRNGESIEFFCNECGRVVFNAVERKERANHA